MPPQARIPGTVWALGAVSFFMDASSELVHALLPLFLSVNLGASMAMIGAIEGAAEAVAQFAKFFSGALSDRSGKRKPWILAGYGLAALTKPLFPLAGSVATVAAARLLDRLGKGIRGAPRDALVADVTPPEIRGAAFGLRQGLDTVGAVLGPLLAAGLLLLYANDLRAAMWWAVVPAAFAVATLVLFVREPAQHASEQRPRYRFRDAGSLPPAFWIVTAAGTLLTLARFSEAFLILRGTSLGLSLAAAPMILVLMSVVYAAASYPAGALSDRVGRRLLLGLGILALIAADIALAFAVDPRALWLGIALWGLHMGLTQGLLAALVADTAPAHLRGTGFGVFYAASGVALLIGSAFAGLLWDRFGAASPFVVGAGLALFALALLPLVHSGRGVEDM